MEAGPDFTIPSGHGVLAKRSKARCIDVGKVGILELSGLIESQH